MNSSTKYVFVGNREYVLKEMIRMGLNITKVWVMENSFLHKKLLNDRFIEYSVVKSKKEFIEELIQTDFDVLVSNGCKYILPITELKERKVRTDILFINVHPSCLPDLKGMDPINGACLFGRSGGATCHYMDDGIDTGSIISRIEIPYSSDIDAGLLFQLSFKAEVAVFRKAVSQDFKLLENVSIPEDTIYYSISTNDLVVDLSKGVDYLLRQSRAFGYGSKGVLIKIGGNEYKFYSAGEINNPYVTNLFKDIPDGQIGIAFEHTVIFRLNDRVVRLNQLSIDNASVLEGVSIDLSF